MKIIIFIGIQGSGKGTQAKIVSEKLNLAHISTGDLLRNASGQLKKQVDFYMQKGELISDDLMLKILKQRMQEKDCKKGIILDGFPRNLEQAFALDKEFLVTKVIEIKISDSEALKRLSGRVNCERCKASYNLLTAPQPKQKGICDICGGKLIQREDDNESAIKKRIQTYHKQTEPILKFYQNKLVTIDGKKEIEKVNEEIISVLKE